ncbi:hypothetical protein V8F06_006664 [Rhypophila decipiens]
MPILYGENTFEIAITNWRSDNASLYYPGALTPILETPYGLFLKQVDEEDEDIQERERKLEQWRQDRGRRCSLLWRFHIQILNDKGSSSDAIRTSLQETTSMILYNREGATDETDNDDDTGCAAAPTTKIEYLSLEFVGDGMDVDDVEGPDPTQKKLFDMIVARLGEASGFRGVVKEVGPITGLPEKIAATLRQTWRHGDSSDNPSDCERRIPRTVATGANNGHHTFASLVQRWEVLNGYVKCIQVHKEDHRTAMLAAEREDADEFHASKRRVIQQLKDLVKKIEDDELLR